MVTPSVTFTRFGFRLYIQNADIPMGTSCAPRAADLLFFYCERDFMLSLSDDNHDK